MKPLSGLLPLIRIVAISLESFDSLLSESGRSRRRHCDEPVQPQPQRTLGHRAHRGASCRGVAKATSGRGRWQTPCAEVIELDTRVRTCGP
jgi:hypothetical protein